MNIFPINSINIYKLNPLKQNTDSYRSHYGLHMANPISSDTISFKAITPKTLDLSKRKNDIPRTVANKIYKICTEKQVYVDRAINKILGNLVVTADNPANIINRICTRTKKPTSIIEKASTLNLRSTEEIFAGIYDLNGVKIIMRDGSRDSVKCVINQFISAIESGDIELLEIENKRPSITQKMHGADVAKYDYADYEDLLKLKETQETIHPRTSVNYDMMDPDYTKTNYTALHFLFKLPGKYKLSNGREEEIKFETQLIGYDVSLYKDLDDIIYKVLANKNVDKKYEKLVKIIKPLTKEENKDLKEQFQKYRSNVFLFQRSKAPHIRKGNDYIEYFLPISDEIEDGDKRKLLDANNLYKIYLQCNKDAETKNKKKIL